LISRKVNHCLLTLLSKHNHSLSRYLSINSYYNYSDSWSKYNYRQSGYLNKTTVTLDI